MPVTSVGSASSPARAAGRRRPRAPQPDADDQLEQLRFLHEVARLATTARTWDELLETVVDRTRDVLHADVSSLYLLDRDGAYLTLAATNGLDRFQIGRARVPFGEGVTGRVAADRQPLLPPDRDIPAIVAGRDLDDVTVAGDARCFGNPRDRLPYADGKRCARCLSGGDDHGKRARTRRVAPELTINRPARRQARETARR